MKEIKNWDNKTWLSSQDYINNFNKFLISNGQLNQNSKILDIGCGRGKILGNLSNKLKLKKKAIGIDVQKHKDRDKRFIFKKMNAINFINQNKDSFDLILIKQTIHLLRINQIQNFIKLCKKCLTDRGSIMIITLDPYRNKIPTFKLMHIRLQRSLEKDKKIINLIKKNKIFKIKKFLYNVKITKKKYQKMIENRYISTLIPMTYNQINKGIKEIEFKFKTHINFKDKLKCLIIRK